MTTYTIDKDALTVNLMRSVGIDKHQARECADVVLQMLAAPSTSAEPIYQYQLANGNWIDQTKDMYDHLIKRGGATVRAVYLAAPSNLVNGLTEAETDESMSVRGLSQKAVPSYELPSIPWSKEAEMRKAWAAPSTSHSRDDVIRMARKSCDTDKVDAWRGGFWVLTQEELERFAALAAAPSTSPDAQDAARYRWLRDSESIVSPGVDLAYDAHRAAKLGNPKIIDAAIDDAIKGGA